MLIILVIINIVLIREGLLDDAFSSGYPYAAILNVQCINQSPNASTSWRCGSSIVTQYLMLTAAHCVDPSPCDEISIGVTVGQTDRVKGTSFSVHSYMIHEDYGPKYRADIALVRLITALELNDQVSRVALMPDPPYDAIGEMVGWDQNLPIENMTDDFSYFLQHVWKRQDCTGVMEDLPSGTFCAKANNTNYEFTGYPGTPFMVQGYIQTGICSYIDPKRDNTAFVFTDIKYYYDWIIDNSVTIMCKNQDMERLHLNQTLLFNDTQSIMDNETQPIMDNEAQLVVNVANAVILTNETQTVSYNETEIDDKSLPISKR